MAIRVHLPLGQRQSETSILGTAAGVSSPGAISAVCHGYFPGMLPEPQQHPVTSSLHHLDTRQAPQTPYGHPLEPPLPSESPVTFSQYLGMCSDLPSYPAQHLLEPSALLLSLSFDLPCPFPWPLTAFIPHNLLPGLFCYLSPSHLHVPPPYGV